MVHERPAVTFGAAPRTTVERMIAVELLANRWCKQRPVGITLGMFHRRAIKK
jgi:hypothetical protein